MFYKTGIPKIFGNSQRRSFAKFLRTLFLTGQLRATASQYFAKFTGKHLCESVYFVKLQNVSMQLYLKKDCSTDAFL